MKKIILLLTVRLLLISCSSSSNDSSSSGVYKWSFKLDGVLYQWQGTLQNTEGGVGNYNVINNKGMLSLTNDSPQITIGVQFPSSSTGNFIFNSSSPSSQGFNLLIQNQNLTFNTYDSSFGGTMNVNVASISTNTISTNPTNPGKVIGTFSGTIKKGGSQTLYTITEGSFEAARGQ